MQNPPRRNQENRLSKVGLRSLQWAIILSVSVVLFYLLKLTLPDSREITRQLDDCLQPKIQHGQYSSDDDGKSAEALLNQCPSEAEKWTTWCERYSGDDRTTCTVKVIVAAQQAIKKFNK